MTFTITIFKTTSIVGLTVVVCMALIYFCGTIGCSRQHLRTIEATGEKGDSGTPGSFRSKSVVVNEELIVSITRGKPENRLIAVSENGYALIK